MSDQFTMNWNVPFKHELFKVQLNHELKRNKLGVAVNDVEVLKCKVKASNDSFKVGDANCNFKIEKIENLFHYSLEVDGMEFRHYKKEYMKAYDMWRKEGKEVLVVLDRDTLKVWGNGKPMTTCSKFADHGAITNFTLEDNSCYIRTTSGEKSVTNVLFINNWEVPPVLTLDDETYTHEVPPKRWFFF